MLLSDALEEGGDGSIVLKELPTVDGGDVILLVEFTGSKGVD